MMILPNLLYCASTWSHIKQFHLPYIERLQELGYSVHLAAGGDDLLDEHAYIHSLPIRKKMLSWDNVRAIRQLRKLLRSKDFEVVSVHTSLAAFLCRVARMFSRWRGTLVYTCHGYLFDADEDGKVTKCPKSLFYLFCETFLAAQTDRLIVMNRTDRKSALRYRLCDQVVHIPGMGMSAERCIGTQAQHSLREKMELPDDWVIFGCVGEFSKRKNQVDVIKAYQKICGALPNSLLIFAGDGQLLPECRKVVQEFGLEGKVLFLGQYSPMEPFYLSVDVLVSASRSEGLPFCVMEGLSYHIPVIASRVKGHLDLIRHKENGLLYVLNEPAELAACMLEISQNREMRMKLAADSVLSENYLLDSVLDQHLQFLEIGAQNQHTFLSS